MFRQIRSGIDTNLPARDQTCPALAWNGPQLVWKRPKLTRDASIGLASSKSRPKSTKFDQRCPGKRPHSADFDEIRSELGRIRPKLARALARCGQSWPDDGQIWRELDQIWADIGQTCALGEGSLVTGVQIVTNLMQLHRARPFPSRAPTPRTCFQQRRQATTEAGGWFRHAIAASIVLPGITRCWIEEYGATSSLNLLHARHEAQCGEWTECR